MARSDDPNVITRWLSDVELEVSADWRIGGTVTSHGNWHGLDIRNKGQVVAIEAERLLVYTHWSSLSQVPDRDENYAVIHMELADQNEGVTLALKQENLVTADIYHHWNFYWTMALARIKQLAESGRL